MAVTNSGTSGTLRTNYARIGHAAQEIFPKILQELLSIKVPQAGLHSNVSSDVYLRRTLNATEWSMINNARTHGYVNFDIPLIYKLIRNLSVVPPPTRGWERGYPAAAEITEGDDIERIRQTRNKILHRGNTKVSDTELKDNFDLFKDIARRLEQYLSKPEDEFVKLFTESENCSMDEETEKMYIENLEQLKKREEDVKRELENIQDKMRKLDYPDCLQTTINAWVEENKNFVKTNIVEYILDHLKKHHVFCLSGISGIGKSATIQHIALHLRDKQGYTIYPCDCPSEIKTYYNAEQKQVFVFNDVCGNNTLLKTYVEKWKKLEDSLISLMYSGNIKVLVTCRSQIYNDPQFRRIELFKGNHPGLSFDTYTFNLKVQIAEQYLSKDEFDYIKNEIGLLKFINKFDFLPLMFAMKKRFNNADPEAFFNNPFDIYTKEMKHIESTDNLKFCALFYLVVQNGFIDQSSFDDEETEQDRKTRKNVFEACGLQRGTPRNKIYEQLSILQDFLVKKSTRFPSRVGYTAIHDKMFDFLCLYFGRNLQKAFLRYADTNVITKRTLLKSFLECGTRCSSNELKGFTMDTDEEFTILIKESNEQHYFERIIKDLLLGRLSIVEVFWKHQMTSTVYRRKLLYVLQKLDNEIWSKLIALKDEDGQGLISYFFKSGQYVTSSTGIHEDDDYWYKDKLYFIHKNDYNDDDLSHDRYKFVELFLEKGANVNAEDNYGTSALTIACGRIYISIVKLLLERGANVNPDKDNPRFTPLMALLCARCKESKYFKDKYTIFKLILEKGAKVNTLNEYGSPLTIACRECSIEFVRMLIENGAKPNSVDKSRRSPLTIACNRSDTRIVKYLIDKGAEVNPENYGLKETPLTAACDFQIENHFKLEIVKLLLDYGANINTVDRSGNSPLTNACRCDDYLLVRFLIENGADVNLVNYPLQETAITAACTSPGQFFTCFDTEQIVVLLLNKGAKINTVDRSGNSPLTNACRLGDKTVITFLTDKGADINLDDSNLKWTPLTAILENRLRFKDQHNIVELLLQKGANVNTIDNQENFPLTLACAKHSKELVTLLVENGAEVNPANHKVKCTPLTAVLNTNRSEDHYKIVEILLEKGANCNIIDKQGKYPLTIACDRDSIALVKLLVQKGANVNVVDKHGDSPLTAASSHGNLDLVKYLIEEGAQVNPDNKDVKLTPITAACWNNTIKHVIRTQIPIIELLLEKGAHVNDVDSSGNSPLTLACWFGDIKLIRFLIEKNADVKLDHHHLKKSPITALCDVCKANADLYQIVDLLLEKGAYVNTVDRSGNSPLTNACHWGDITLVRLLIEKGAEINLDDDHLKKTPITAACHDDSYSLGRYKIIDLLLGKGVNINTVDRSGNSPLTNACREFNITLVIFLLKNGADINFDNDHLKETPITAVCANETHSRRKGRDRYKIIDLLLGKGVNINTVDRSENSPLTNACRIINSTLVDFLIEKGADVNLRNDHLKETPITAACNFDKFMLCSDIIVRKLLDKGAIVNTVDRSGNSPLINACRQGNIELVELLLDRGADVHLSNAGLHQTPLTAACDVEDHQVNYKIIELLLYQGLQVHGVDKNGKSPLKLAYNRCNLKLVIFLHNSNPNNDVSVCECMYLVGNFLKENNVNSVDHLTQCQQKALICLLEKEDINYTYRTSVEQKHIESMDILNSTKCPSTENIENEIPAKRKTEES